MFRALLPSLVIGLFVTCLNADEPRRDDQGRPQPRLRDGDRPREGDRDPVARPRLNRAPRDAERPRDPDRRPELPRGRGEPRPDPDHPDPRHAAAVADLTHRLVELRRTQHELREQRAGDERLERIRREIDDTERELDRAMHRRPGPPPGHPPEHHHPPEQHAAVLERIEHLHIAAEHLTHAGMHEMARRARDHAAEIERDFHGHQRPGHDIASNPVVRELHEQLEALRREVTALHEQVRRLTQDR